MSNDSQFYNLPGTHKPFHHHEQQPLLQNLIPTYGNAEAQHRHSSTYFRRTSFHQKLPPLRENDYEKEEESSYKLNTFNGVFVPTALNVLSILMFLRFGFIIGQMGVLGTLGLLLMSYIIDLLTTLSISAIATNGTVRGGGAYYMISRSLGPEFGGSIGLVFYFGQVLNSGLNVVGFIEPLLANFGETDGVMLRIFPQGYWWEFTYSSVLLLSCICIALVGSQMVSKAGLFLFVLLLASTISIPISSLVVKPFEVEPYKLWYMGPSWAVLKENLLPHFTKGAAGSLLKGKETFNDLFGIFYPATAGIFAGASMSGDLKKPSKSIPRGTLWGLLLTFACYSLVILSLGSAVPRKLLHKDVQIVQTVNVSASIILIGEISTSLFSVIVGVVGAANVLQAIARDSIFPKLDVFAKVDSKSNNPINAIIVTWILTQLCIFANVNQIATFITMAFLMTFIVTNLACFLLKIASAPNFRPSFKYFDWHTALAGLIVCAIAMFIVDGISATIVVIFLIALFIFIHYVCPPKPWGDVSQSLIYHQVRKYLLRLRQDNVKYWRPQILLLVDSPRSSWNLIQFCNHLKKGGLYILGHVIVTESFQNNFAEFTKQQNAWLKVRDLSKVKAFVQIGLGPTLPWGVRNVILGSGLGGMRPNITVLGMFDMKKHYPTPKRHPASKKPNHHAINIEKLPTDDCRNEKRVSIQKWVSIIEDLILMKSNVAVAKGFETFNIPESQTAKPYDERQFIDLYPIQMSAEVFDSSGEVSALTTNFDTYTLILQLGAILSTVPNWKKTHRLRIVVFVEDKEDIANEQDRVQSLIEVLRIKAVILVVCLKDFKNYNTIVKGTNDNFKDVDKILGNEGWWTELKSARYSAETESRLSTIPSIHIAPPFINNLDHIQNKRLGLSKLQRMGLSISMTTNRLNDNNIHKVIESDFYSDDDEDDSDSVYSEADLFQLQNHGSKFNKIRRSYTDVGESNVTSFNDSKSHIPTDTNTSGAVTPNLKSSKPPSVSSSIANLNTSNKMNARPIFSSEKIPRSKVIDDATGDQPSIVLLPDDQTSIRSKKLTYKDFKVKGEQSAPKESAALNVKFDELSPKHKCRDDLGVDDGFSLPKPATSSNMNVVTEADEDADEDAIVDEGIDINDLTFDDLPAKGQHLILNDVMKTLSSDVPVIFTTLPAPSVGTHYNEEECKEYLQNLEVWLEDLPPVMLVNSQSITVTTAL